MHSDNTNIHLNHDFNNVFSLTDLNNQFKVPEDDDPFYEFLNLVESCDESDETVVHQAYEEKAEIVQLDINDIHEDVDADSKGANTEPSYHFTNSVKNAQHSGLQLVPVVATGIKKIHHEHTTKLSIKYDNEYYMSDIEDELMLMNEFNNPLTGKYDHFEPIYAQAVAPPLQKIKPVTSDGRQIFTSPHSSKRIVFLNTDATKYPPMPGGPKTFITAKTIAYICNQKYTDRVQNAIVASYDYIRAMIPENSNNHNVLPIENVFLTYMAFSLPNGYAMVDFEHIQNINGWSYYKNSSQPLDKLPMRFQGFRANFYEPIIKRIKRKENGSAIREALCPYCPVDFTNLTRCFFDTDGCSYQHHVSRNHGVWNRGYEMPPPLVYEAGFKRHRGICPLCTKDIGIVKLSNPDSIFDGSTLYNSFITYHKHVIRNHNITKKCRSPMLLQMDMKWFDTIDVHALKYESQIYLL